MEKELAKGESCSMCGEKATRKCEEIFYKTCGVSLCSKCDHSDTPECRHRIYYSACRGVTD